MPFVIAFYLLCRWYHGATWSSWQLRGWISCAGLCPPVHPWKSTSAALTTAPAACALTQTWYLELNWCLCACACVWYWGQRSLRHTCPPGITKELPPLHGFGPPGSQNWHPVPLDTKVRAHWDFSSRKKQVDSRHLNKIKLVFYFIWPMLLN